MRKPGSANPGFFSGNPEVVAYDPVSFPKHCEPVNGLQRLTGTLAPNFRFTCPNITGEAYALTQ